MKKILTKAKTAYWLGACHSRFYLGGLSRGTQRKRDLQNVEFLHIVVPEPVPVRLEGRCLIYVTTELDEKQRLNVNVIITCVILTLTDG